jgi:hypothetical protein
MGWGRRRKIQYTKRSPAQASNSGFSGSQSASVSSLGLGRNCSVVEGTGLKLRWVCCWTGWPYIVVQCMELSTRTAVSLLSNCVMHKAIII